MRGVDRETKSGIAIGDGAADAILDKGVAAADIELVHSKSTGRGLGGRLQARLGDRAQHMGGAKGAGTARDACGCTSIEQFERADRRQHHRQPHSAAERFDRRIDLGDIAQYPRPERDLVERHAVAAHRGLGLGGADDVVPIILVEVGARFPNEFVQVLELFAASAEFDRRWDAGRFVHKILPGERDCFAIAIRLSRPALPRHPENCYGRYQREHCKNPGL